MVQFTEVKFKALSMFHSWRCSRFLTGFSCMAFIVFHCTRSITVMSQFESHCLIAVTILQTNGVFDSSQVCVLSLRTIEKTLILKKTSLLDLSLYQVLKGQLYVRNNRRSTNLQTLIPRSCLTIYILSRDP